MNTLRRFPKINHIDRVLGSVQGAKRGPLVIFFAGIHGNEQAGVYALQKVMHALKKKTDQLKGTVYAIAGNRAALLEKKRYIGKDLNRIWFPNTLISPEERDAIPEYGEKIDILNTLVQIVGNQKSAYLFDLHTTSSHSTPFISISDTLKNRKIIRNIPAHLVLGLEELLDGPMFSFFSELGLPAILFEAGQHEAISSFENHMAFVWLMLRELKCLKKNDVPDYQQQLQTLKKNYPEGPKIFQIKHRHLIQSDEQFKMKDGFVNFQSVQKGEEIAQNEHGIIQAHINGNIFMPLYQSVGCDGYFLVRQIKPFWFKLSSRTRKWKLDHILRLLPGISHQAGEESTFIIDKNIARYRVISLLHLLGYRKVRVNGHTLMMSRRPYDKRFPDLATVKNNMQQYLKMLGSMAIKKS